MHEYAPLAITLVAIFAGILVNKSDIHSLKADLNTLKADQAGNLAQLKADQAGSLAQLRAEMKHGFERVDKQFDEVNVRLLGIEAYLRQFYSITGEFKARVDLLEKRR